MIGLPEGGSSASRMAYELGAIKGIYEIARVEFDILRNLATLALKGDPDAVAELQKYLLVQYEIAELYTKDLEKTK